MREKMHRIEISDELFNKLEEIRKQKKLTGTGPAAEYYIEKLEENRRTT